MHKAYERSTQKETMVVLTITQDGIELSEAGDFTVLKDYMNISPDSLIFLHVSGTSARVVNQNDLKLVAGLIYKNKHDGYR